MTFSEENRRKAISWTVTLLTHAVLLLVPLSFHPIRSQGESLTGYFATMVELEQTSPAPPEKQQLAEKSPVTSAPIKPAPTKSSQNTVDNKQPETPVKERIAAADADLKTTPKPEATEKTDETTAKTEMDNEQSKGTIGQNEPSTREPTRANLGNGNGQIIKGTSPIYPKNAQNHKIAGTVRCRLLIRADGRIAEVKILASSGDSSLDNSVLHALTNNTMWKFKPAESAYFVVLDFVFSVTKVDINYVKAGWEDEDQ